MSEASDNRLTTHVLDVARGRPAASVDLVLSRFVDGVATSITSATTNADGRTDAALLEGDAFAPGRYELTFAVGDYFASLAGGGVDATADEVGAVPTAIAYLDIVPIRFGVATGTGHLHVALLVTPWSYTTYRGS